MDSVRDDPKGPGFPIRTFTDQSLLTAPHDFSQCATSFIASWCQGIHQMLLKRLIQRNPSRAGINPNTHHGSDRYQDQIRTLSLQYPLAMGIDPTERNQSQKLLSTNRFTMLNSRNTARHIRNRPHFNLTCQRQTPTEKIRYRYPSLGEQSPQRKISPIPVSYFSVGLNSAKSLVEADGIEPTT